MKTRVILIIGILLLSYNLANSKELGTVTADSRTGSMNVFTSPDLYPLTAQWVEEYSKLNPQLKMQLIITTDAEIPNLLKTTSAMGFITDESYPALKNQSIWNMVVGRNVIVPVMNQTNPFKDEIYHKGITSAQFARLLAKTEINNWEELLGNISNKANHPVHLYFLNDPAINSGIANFTNLKELKNKGIQMNSEKELLSAIQNDPYGIGFCRLTGMADQNNQSITAQLTLVPIDKNGNGKIDYSESIYNNVQEFSRGVWIGRYPMALSGKIYSVSSTKPQNKAELSFLNWVLIDGQQYLTSKGFSDLVSNERQSQLAKINEPAVFATTTAPETNTPLMVKFLIILAIGITVVVLEIVTRPVRIRNRASSAPLLNLQKVIDQAEVVVPKGLYFDKTHTWAFMKKDGTVKLGIDDFLQHVTGPITRVEMKNSGDKIKKGEHLVTIIQKGKQLNIYSPVTGIITSQNKNLLSQSGLLNSAPFTDGWVYIVEPTNWSLEIQFMNMAEKYTNWLKSEYTRLKEFFASAVRVHVPAFILVLQDGGVLRDGILAEMGPEIWEDFQTKFIDPIK